MLFRLLIILLLFSSSNTILLGGEVVITGVYQGKNLYVHNPACGERNFSTQFVYVNGILSINNPSTSAYEIVLSGLTINTPVTIKIVYHEDCEPRLINPQVIKPKSSFAFIAISVSDDSLRWSTAGENGSHKFLIERLENENWTLINAADGTGEKKSDYARPLSHRLGKNQYRIRYINNEGKTEFSNVITYVSEKEPISFYPQSVTNKITLSRIAAYEVLDPDGNLVAKGKDKEIILKDLNPGLYYLVIEDRTEKFLKK